MPLPSYRFSSGSISIANPISGDRIAMTNAHWDFSIEQTRKSSRLERLIMLNDWESVALSLPSLQDSDLERINDRPADSSGNRALCGVGTGLGVAGLVAAKDGTWVPVAGEGGHVSFSPVDQEEAQILEILSENHTTMSLSRRSCPALDLAVLHQAIAAINGDTVEGLAPQRSWPTRRRRTIQYVKKPSRYFVGYSGTSLETSA